MRLVRLLLAYAAWYERQDRRLGAWGDRRLPGLAQRWPWRYDDVQVRDKHRGELAAREAAIERYSLQAGDKMTVPIVFAGVLNFIADAIADIGRMVLWALVSVLNLLIAAVGLALTAVASLFPELPPPLVPPENMEKVLGALSWVLPMGAIVGVLATALAAYVAVLLLRIGARWLKLMRG